MNLKESRSCAGCRHWLATGDKGECRGATPIGDGKWPMTHKTDWCGEFAPNVHAVGSKPRVSDEELIEMVRFYSEPQVINGEPHLGIATKRSELVTKLMDLGMARTPATKRIETMVRRGIFKQGDNPWPKPYATPGIYVWMEVEAAGGAPEPKEETNAEGQFLEAVRAFTGSHANACSLRSIHRQLEDVMPMSLATVSRKMAPLVSAGLVTVCDEGYYAEAATMEVDA